MTDYAIIDGSAVVYAAAESHFDALITYLCNNCGADTTDVEVVDGAGTSRRVLTMACGACCVPIFEDENWMLGERVNEFQHVNCYE